MSLDAETLKKWIELRKKKLQDQQDNKQAINLPNGIQIHIHMPKPQQLPLSPKTGRLETTTDAPSAFPS